MSDWKECILEKIALVNPKESLKKDTIAKKISMDLLSSFSRKVNGFTIEKYNGGMKFRNGDTVIARITPCLENGKTAYIDVLDENEVGFGSTEFIVLREKPNISDRKFLYYFAISNEFRDVAILSMTGSSGRQRVEIDVVKNHSFFLPPLLEQKAIASVLSSLDDKIDLLHRQNKTLEAMAETLFRQWFGEKENDDTINQFVIIQNGYAFKSGDFKENGINGVIKIKNISGGMIDIQQTDFIDESVAFNVQKRFEILSGDILIAMTGAEIGKLGIVPKTEQKLWLNQRVGLLKEKYKGSKYLAYLQLKSDFGQDYIENTATGSAQPNISGDGIEKCGFPKLSQEEIKNCSEQIGELFEKVIFNMGEIRTLEKLRDNLLPKLMSGEVRVLNHD